MTATHNAPRLELAEAPQQLGRVIDREAAERAAADLLVALGADVELLVVANHGDCPLGGVQERLGDPVPLFELVLSPRAARWAVPALGGVRVAGVALLARPCR